MAHERLTRPRRRDELLRLFVESVTDYAIFMLDPDGRIVSWNQGAARIKGYTADEVIGKHFSIFYPKEAIERGWPDRELVIAAQTGRAEDEGWRLRKDGTRFWANVVITAVRDDAGGLAGFAKVTRDLTERHTLEQVSEAALAHVSLDDLLAEILKRVAEALSTDTAAVLLLAGDGQALVARAAKGLSEEVESGLRVPIGEGFAGRIASERRPRVVDDVDRSDALNPILREKGIHAMMGVPLTVDGRVIGVLHVGTLRQRTFGEADVRLLQLIGDRVALAIDRARLYDAAQEARLHADVAESQVEQREEFISIAAHELKTPMTSVKAATQLLLRAFERAGGGDERQRSALRMIDAQITKLGHLVTQLLDTARLQSGELVLNLADADLCGLVREVAEQVQATTGRHQIVVNAPDTFIARVDPLRLDQVITNLLDNAVKYTPGGLIELVLSSPSASNVVISVRDHGAGVPKEHRPRLFERFYQAHADRAGMGLGLYVSRQIVERHGGTIYAEFPADGGARFVVSLPVHVGSEPESLIAI